MFKKVKFQGLNYKDLDRLGEHDLKRDEMRSFYQTFDFLELVKKWPDVVGPKLAAVTAPLKIKQDALFVVVKHAAYAQELSYCSEMIKGQIDKVLPELRLIVKRLVYQTQESFFEVKKTEEAAKVQIRERLHPQSPVYKLREAEARQLFGQIADEELRKVMISIYIQSR